MENNKKIEYVTKPFEQLTGLPSKDSQSIGFTFAKKITDFFITSSLI